ncbi:MAG TPA: cytochrome b/b6 domain-containing protein [Puia sp.]|nr:cytochrome b/b6 domain-containing protein [Puia sp.]
MITETYKLKTVAGGPTFLEPHSLAIRIWHWALVVFIFGAVTTVGLATFVFNTGQNIPLVQHQLQGKGVTVDAPTARAVSHAFNDKVWFLHKWIGYGIALLVLSRWLLEVLLPAPERLARKMRLAAGFQPTTPEQEREKKHYLTIKWTYIVFYVLILVMALTGLVLAFEDVAFFQSIRRPVKSVHSFTQYLIYAFALIHIAGVVRADNLRYPGLVSRMISGRKTHL